MLIVEPTSAQVRVLSMAAYASRRRHAGVSCLLPGWRGLPTTMPVLKTVALHAPTVQLALP